MAGYGVRGVEIVRHKQGIPYVMDPTFYDCSANRDQDILPGRFAVLESDGTLDGCRGANDTANGGSGALKIFGLVAEVYDTKGKLLDNQFCAKEVACKVRVWRDLGNLIFRMKEDAAGGAISTYTGSVAIVDGTAISKDNTDNRFPNPVPTDLIDSSTRHATVTQHALHLLGLDPDIRGINNTANVFLFDLVSTYLAS